MASEFSRSTGPFFCIWNGTVGLGGTNRIAVGFDVYAIERDVRLVSTAARDVTVFGDAGLQGEQRKHIAGF